MGISGGGLDSFSFQQLQRSRVGATPWFLLLTERLLALRIAAERSFLPTVLLWFALGVSKRAGAFQRKIADTTGFAPLALPAGASMQTMGLPGGR